MDKDRKLILEKKRQELKGLSERRSRMELVSDFTEALNANAITYEMEFDSSAWDWICDNFSVTQWGRINWDDVENKKQLKWSSDEQLQVLFEKLFTEISLKDEIITVIWSNALRPAIKMSLNDVRPVIQELFDEDMDTWVVSEKNQWCIECHHDGDLSIAIKK